jgi:hypothetical protein
VFGSDPFQELRAVLPLRQAAPATSPWRGRIASFEPVGALFINPPRQGEVAPQASEGEDGDVAMVSALWCWIGRQYPRNG